MDTFIKLTNASGKTFKGSANSDTITVAGDDVTVDLSGNDIVNVAAGVKRFTVTNFDASDLLNFADTVTSVVYDNNALKVTVSGQIITINGVLAPTAEDNKWLSESNGKAVFGKSAGNVYTVSNKTNVNYTNQAAAT